MYHTDRRSYWSKEIHFAQEKAHTFDLNIVGTIQNPRGVASVIKKFNKSSTRIVAVKPDNSQKARIYVIEDYGQKSMVPAIRKF